MQIENKAYCSASIEIGSGVTRFCVADVLLGKDHSSIEKIHVEKTKDIFFAEHAKHHQNTLQETIYQEALKALNEYKQIAKELGSERICIVATDIFRKATNGSEFIERLSIELDCKIKIINQEEEGELGFLTIAHAARQICPSISIDNLVAWDSGNSSAQVSIYKNNAFTVYKSPYGRIPLQSALEQIQTEKYGDIPPFVTKEEIKLLQKQIIENSPIVQETLQEVVSSGITCRKYSNKIIIELFEKELDNQPISRKVIKHKLDRFLNEIHQETHTKGPEWNDKLDRLLMLVSIHTMMKKLNISHLRMIKVMTGNSYGIFLKQGIWE